MSSTNELSILDLALGTESQASDLLRSLGIEPTSLGLTAAETASTDPLQGVTDAIKALAEDVSAKIGALGDRIDALETRPQDPPVVRQDSVLNPVNTSTPASEARSGSTSPGVNTSAETRRLWADREVHEAPDYDEIVVWPDEDDDLLTKSRLFAVAEPTERFLKDSFSKGIPNATRKQWKERYGDPRCSATRVPKLDKIVKDRMKPDSIKLDKTLARIQALTLDVVGPLTTVVDEGEAGTLTAEKALAATRLALKFAGNASIQTSRERRKRARTRSLLTCLTGMPFFRMLPPISSETILQRKQRNGRTN